MDHYVGLDKMDDYMDSHILECYKDHDQDVYDLYNEFLQYGGLKNRMDYILSSKNKKAYMPLDDFFRMTKRGKFISYASEVKLTNIFNLKLKEVLDEYFDSSIVFIANNRKEFVKDDERLIDEINIFIKEVSGSDPDLIYAMEYDPSLKDGEFVIDMYNFQRKKF